ncbi:hypothetical protein MUG87_04270 [Ectobacillus sp. JY-23]|uniref:hypothetical protein n=1 Tax=Ectobacillus sp. JY-23 TaxID=2933872 RepID=UPI001FF26DCB|nr:hypothetical protein [Ectobacillus sp. JY-23]UOY93350.1 hypothetical protein MUG87_04270 [Ectobacillus sp. JY-23]
MKLLYNQTSENTQLYELEKERIAHYMERIYHEFDIEIKPIHWIAMTEQDARHLYEFYKRKTKK